MTPTHTLTTQAVADDATEPMQSDQIEGSRPQADQAAWVEDTYLSRRARKDRYLQEWLNA